MSEKLPATPDQEQLESQVHAVYSTIDFEHPENNSAKLENPLTAEEQAAHVAVLDQFLQGDEDKMPESMKIKRDWSDTLEQHNEKRRARAEIVLDTIAHRIEGSTKLTAAREQREQDEAKLAAAREQDEAKLAARRQQIKAHNDNIRVREAAQKPKGYMQLYMDTFKEAPEPEYTDSVVDIDKLKAERREGEPTKAQASQQKTIDALQDFRRGFSEDNGKAERNGVDPRSIKVNKFYDDVNHKKIAPAIEGVTLELPKVDDEASRTPDPEAPTEIKEPETSADAEEEIRFTVNLADPKKQLNEFLKAHGIAANKRTRAYLEKILVFEANLLEEDKVSEQGEDKKPATMETLRELFEKNTSEEKDKNHEFVLTKEDIEDLKVVEGIWEEVPTHRETAKDLIKNPPKPQIGKLWEKLKTRTTSSEKVGTAAVASVAEGNSDSEENKNLLTGDEWYIERARKEGKDSLIVDHGEELVVSVDDYLNAHGFDLSDHNRQILYGLLEKNNTNISDEHDTTLRVPEQVVEVLERRKAKVTA